MELGHSPEILALAALPCTDIGNGDRFIAQFGATFKFITGQGWTYFNGSRWTGHGARDAAFEAAKLVAKRIDDEIAAAQHLGHGVTDRRDWARRSQSAQRLQAMLSCARTGLVVGLDQFDVDRLAVGTPNGVLSFERQSPQEVSVRFRTAKAADFITRQTAATYEPSAKAPLWGRSTLRASNLTRKCARTFNDASGTRCWGQRESSPFLSMSVRAATASPLQ